MGVPGFAGGTQGWGTTGGMEGNFLGAPRGDIWGWGSWGILGKNRGGAPGEPRGSTGVPGHLEDGGPGAFLGGSGERRYGDGGTGMGVRGWRYGDGGTGMGVPAFSTVRRTALSVISGAGGRRVSTAKGLGPRDRTQRYTARTTKRRGRRRRRANIPYGSMALLRRSELPLPAALRLAPPPPRPSTNPRPPALSHAPSSKPRPPVPRPRGACRVLQSRALPAGSQDYSSRQAAGRRLRTAARPG